MAKKHTQCEENASAGAERAVRDLAKVAFANILDFASFRADGSVQIDRKKAREVGAKVSITLAKSDRDRFERPKLQCRTRLPR